MASLISMTRIPSMLEATTVLDCLLARIMNSVGRTLSITRNSIILETNRESSLKIRSFNTPHASS
jgi:hypothetical protein